MSTETLTGQLEETVLGFKIKTSSSMEHQVSLFHPNAQSRQIRTLSMLRFNISLLTAGKRSGCIFCHGSIDRLGKYPKVCISGPQQLMPWSPNSCKMVPNQNRWILSNGLNLFCFQYNLSNGLIGWLHLQYTVRLIAYTVQPLKWSNCLDSQYNLSNGPIDCRYSTTPLTLVFWNPWCNYFARPKKGRF